MILEPISIATAGYAAPASAQAGPRPLAIASDGYIRFRGVRRGAGGGHGARIQYPVDKSTVTDDDVEQLALLAVIVIDQLEN